MHYKTFNKLASLARWVLLFINIHLTIFLVANISIFIEYRANYDDAMQSLTSEVHTNNNLLKELNKCKTINY